MEWQVILVLVLVAPFLLLPVAFIWYLNIGGLYQAIRQGQLKEKVLLELACSTDADCLPGYVCVNRKCVRAN